MQAYLNAGNSGYYQVTCNAVTYNGSIWFMNYDNVNSGSITRFNGLTYNSNSLSNGLIYAATVYNGLASLTGQPTIGGMAVDLLGGGSNLGTGGPRRNEESGRRSNYEPPEPKEPESTIKKPPEIERFRERYLIPVVNRPTPSQKWGRRAARDRPPA